MAIREKIKEIEDALDTMILSNESGESFTNLKKAVADKIRETEEAAGVILSQRDVDVSDEIRGKIKEVENATGNLLSLDDDAVSKEIGEKIKTLVSEIKDATDVMIFDDKMKK